MTEWIRINKDKLPDTEVLAGCFDVKGTGHYQEVLVGYVGINKDGDLVCESDNEVLPNPSHYHVIYRKDMDWEKQQLRYAAIAVVSSCILVTLITYLLVSLSN